MTIGLAVMYGWWVILACFLGWVLMGTIKRELFLIKYFPKSYRRIVWRHRLKGALQVLPGLVLLVAFAAAIVWLFDVQPGTFGQRHW
jgi:hypothetical protein